MSEILYGIAWTLGGVLLIAGLVAAVRWAKRAGRKAATIGGALMLLMSMGVVPPQELQRIEEAKEPKGKKGAESGDPPESGLPKRPEP